MGEGILTLLAAEVLQVKVKKEMISVPIKVTGGKSLKGVRTVKYKYTSKPFSVLPLVYDLFRCERGMLKRELSFSRIKRCLPTGT